MWTRNLSGSQGCNTRQGLHASGANLMLRRLRITYQGGFPLRKTLGLLLAAVTLVGVTGVATAGDNGPPPRVQNILGMVLSQHASPFASRPRGAGNLLNHGGPVQHGSTAYSIYWVPSGYSESSDYSTVINRYFTDVSADSGKTSNVYYSDTQYSDSSGKIP